MPFRIGQVTFACIHWADDYRENHSLVFPSRQFPDSLDTHVFQREYLITKGVLMAKAWFADWLVGANGIYRGGDDGSWSRIGKFDFHVNAIAWTQKGLFAGVNCGVWEINETRGDWLQLHDETVTEVLSVAFRDDETGIIVGSPYGVATGAKDGLGAYRWTGHSDCMRVNERFTNAILAFQEEDGAYLVGTEAGVLLVHNKLNRWERTNLCAGPSRALRFAHGYYWAGTDNSGVWKSLDGLRWDRAGYGIDDETIFDVQSTADGLVCATAAGFVEGDGTGAWRRSGPGIRAACIGVHPELRGHWLGGAYPGGLWLTEDRGATWVQCGSFVKVRAISAGREE